MDQGVFQLRMDIQGHAQQTQSNLTRAQVEDALLRHLQDWLHAPERLLQLTCGDVRITVVSGETSSSPIGTAIPSGHQASQNNDAIMDESMASFPASDPPSSTGSTIAPED